MRRLTRRAPTCLLLATLTGCANQLETAGTVKQMCSGVPPISTSRCDVLTDQTALDIERDTAAKRVWCGPVPVAKQPPPANCPATQAPPKTATPTRPPLRGSTS